MKSYINCLKRVFDFSGSGTVSEYIIFMVMNYIVIAILCAVFKDSDTIVNLIGILSTIASIASWSACVRALHGIGKSGLLSLLSLIPCCGSLVLLLILIMGGKQ